MFSLEALLKAVPKKRIDSLVLIAPDNKTYEAFVNSKQVTGLLLLRPTDLPEETLQFAREWSGIVVVANSQGKIFGAVSDMNNKLELSRCISQLD